MSKKYDFGGYATRNDLRCTDGRTIRKNAFKNDDGKRVSLVWMHQHNDPENVLGHADLENRPDGVYAYCSFNNTDKAIAAKESVRHGDVRALSIFANNLTLQDGNVYHGDIKEVSLVLAGANPGAYIDELVIAHSDMNNESEAIIWVEPENDGDFLSHGEVVVEDSSEGNDPDVDTDDEYEDDFDDADSDDEYEEEDDDEDEDEELDPEEIADCYDSFTDDQKAVAEILVGAALENADIAHADLDDEDLDAIAEVLDDLEPEQRAVVEYMVGEALEENIAHAGMDDDDDSDVGLEEEDVMDVYNAMSEKEKKVVAYLLGQALNDSDEDEEENEMKHNVFETMNHEDVLMHNEFLNNVVADAKKYGSLKESYLRHAEFDEEEAAAAGEYGISNISELHPDPHNMNTPPEFISRRMDWVNVVLNGVHKTPFARIKSMFADIREDEARAKGYIKGKRKKEEVFSVLKRVTTPTTIYKKQKLDRDDVIDITSFDVIKWIRAEMEVMLDEEKARAILVGDGRSKIDEDHINDECIRPIWTDDNLYTVKVVIPIDKNATDSVKADKFIEGTIKNRKLYRGSGSPILFTTEDRLTSMQLLKDTTGHYIYDSLEKIASVLRVSKIVTVPVMEGLTRTPEGTNKVLSLEGLIVNLIDYNVGTDRNGEKNFFDDFDLDYNALKYLLEGRMSGALVKPYSAMAIEFDDGTTTV